MIQGADHLLRQHLIVVENIFDGSGRRARHSIAEVRFPFQRRAFVQSFVQLRHDLGRMLGALANRVVTLVFCQLRQVHFLAQRSPEVRRVRGDIQIPFARRMQTRDAA
ncbi:hypothetical protein GCM10011487_07980 [Steroidobacter agaridevorans]|uniref:Uncharacterized protein n=1 Tax=Steroidobacter agaridevorans TaxID=2695856 RepID=A0A829Y7A6_9GAMM|nr:hypothetical protein GCM10011487_07980 [Steroidobacter agaridevorans]